MKWKILFLFLLLLMVSGLSAQTTNTFKGVTLTGVNVSFSPRSLGCCLVDWWSPDSGFTIDTTLGTNSVSQWNDIIGTKHLAFPTKGNMPVYTNDAAAGISVWFDGVGMRLTNNAVSTYVTGNDTPFTFWMVCKPITSSNSGLVNFGNSTVGVGTTNSIIAFKTLQAGTNMRYTRTDDANNNVNNNLAGTVSNGWNFMAFSFTGTRVTLSLNGTLSDAANNTGAITVDTFCVGQFFRSGAFSTPQCGTIAEMGLVTNSISTNLINQLYFNYAKPRYNLP